MQFTLSSFLVSRRYHYHRGGVRNRGVTVLSWTVLSKLAGEHLGVIHESDPEPAVGFKLPSQSIFCLKLISKLMLLTNPS